MILTRRAKSGRCRWHSAVPAMTGHRIRNWLAMTPRTLTFEGCDRPIKANFGDVGYYRVRYERMA